MDKDVHPPLPGVKTAQTNQCNANLLFLQWIPWFGPKSVSFGIALLRHCCRKGHRTRLRARDPWKVLQWFPEYKLSHSFRPTKRNIFSSSLCDVLIKARNCSIFALMEAASLREKWIPWEAKKRDGENEFFHTQRWVAESNQPWSYTLHGLSIIAELSLTVVFFPFLYYLYLEAINH